MVVDINICGAHNPLSMEAEEHARKYYNSIRARVDDIVNIANNTKYTVEQISIVKSHIFFAYHDLGGEKLEMFKPDFYMAESWRRLSGKNKKHIQKHDLTLLKHELLEINLMWEGKSQNKAHIRATRAFNYSKETLEFYEKMGLGDSKVSIKNKK